MAGISFDRAAKYHDATRGLPAEVTRDLTDILVSELGGKARCLEIGVGTGRIALPLSERGVELIGVDLAPAMLARLIANAGGDQPFPLVMADITGLPLAGRSVDAVLGSHILHLIADWESAVDEALRVLRPGGALLVDFGGLSPTPWSDDCAEIRSSSPNAPAWPRIWNNGKTRSWHGPGRTHPNRCAAPAVRSGLRQPRSAGSATSKFPSKRLFSGGHSTV